MVQEATPAASFTFEDAAELVAHIGILPLAPLIPEHPSLKSLTREEDWHTDTELDPWQWRVRFPGEGQATYGKFLKKRPCWSQGNGSLILLPYREMPVRLRTATTTA